MKFIDSIKKYIASFILKNKLKNHSREKAFHNFESARTIGLICNAQDQKIYYHAKQFSEFLYAKNIKVYAIGFIEGDAVLDAFSYQKGFNFISNKDLNWLKIPHGEIVENFIDNKFDILINLILEENFQVDYLVGLSQAKFKIGYIPSDGKWYDLTINITSNPKLEFFIEQVKHYLTMIKK
ncbi:MAG: hypothetical protein A2275_06255 [Bacteroidetes bacterium RIFOXYA12_FULL_35_11]|nr:MAG: hypothetical protein A2X01_18465 [Bacteroidetes bacterium GWF2_35_48]OFY77075.1 MAG: hypothetical protein A2275_06255 [Bacteroidetes bacterium RIFOXYA12_FULL_35_11]OFY94603.1 MAG: hypothetical protein A2491_16110 [Bacteroidetes bacterium RIFOXYC12_FULL_35_7]HBX51138.1 hypothetical protein [Bacteroidales bacterium]